MRILVVSHYFPPEIGAPQARLGDLTRLWSDGDDVTVLTGMPNHPTGIVHSGYRHKVWMRERVDGVDVVRTWLYATPNENVLKKTLGHLSFMVTSVVLGWRATGRPDVVVVSSPTFFSIASAWLLARAKRARLVVEVRDLWPAIFVELGVVTNRTIIRLLERLELLAYRAADVVVTVSEGFRDHITARGIDPGKVHVIPNGVDVERFAPRDVGVEDMRRRLGVPAGHTLALYIGAHGISHGLTSVADAAAKLAHDGVHVAFVGEGAARGELVARVNELGASNITLHAGVPRWEVPTVLAAADICLVPLRDVPLFERFIPSKIFEYLAAGKPVVGALRGEAAGILKRAGAVVVAPQDPDALATAIRALAGDPERRAAMGAASREFVTRNYDRRELADRYRRLLA